VADQAEFPPAFTARTRYQYRVPVVSPVSSNAVASAAAVPVPAGAQPVVPSRLRSTSKPVSLVALSVQVRWISVADVAEAASAEGAAGGATVVVALAVEDHAELPPAFTARTRYQYWVAAVSPESSNVVAFAAEVPT